MSGSSIASVAWSSVAVPTGPKTGRGLGSNDMTHRVVTMSLRSVMWSLCRCVRNNAAERPGARCHRCGAHQDTAPAVEQQVPDPVRTSVPGQPALGSGSGLPLPRMITCNRGSSRRAPARRPGQLGTVGKMVRHATRGVSGDENERTRYGGSSPRVGRAVRAASTPRSHSCSTWSRPVTRARCSS